MVKSITVEINGEDVVLPIEEARRLQACLNELMKDSAPYVPPSFNPWPIQPSQPLYGPVITRFLDGTCAPAGIQEG